MEMILQVLLLVLGFLMLVKGADWFVDGASGIAERFGIPQLVVGLTIVAMGTSMPEAAVSINSALKGNAGITIGNIVGSNILNILIILGITAVITTVAVQKSTIWIEIPMPIRADPVSQAKIHQFEHTLQVWEKQMVLDRIRKIKLPYHRSSKTGIGYMDDLVWSELGDYVREMLRTEREDG